MAPKCLGDPQETNRVVERASTYGDDALLEGYDEDLVVDTTENRHKSPQAIFFLYVHADPYSSLCSSRVYSNSAHQIEATPLISASYQIVAKN